MKPSNIEYRLHKSHLMSALTPIKILNNGHFFCSFNNVIDAIMSSNCAQQKCAFYMTVFTIHM